MSRKSVKREIDGLTVITTQLAPRHAFKLAARLFKYIAPVLGSMKPTDEIDMSTLTPALMSIMRELDDDELDRLMAKVFAGTTVVRPAEGKVEALKCDLCDPEKIDAAFEGRFASMFAVMKFAIEVNFGDFFAEAAPSGEVAAS